MKCFFKFVGESSYRCIYCRNINNNSDEHNNGVKYAPLLGFMIGLFNLIPYIGAIVAVAIAI